LNKDYLSKTFFIEDDILWVQIQTKGEPTRVCDVIPQNRIQEILKNEHGALFNGHEGVAKTRFKRCTGGLVWTRTLQSFFEIVELVRRPNSAGNSPTCLLLHQFDPSTGALGHDRGTRGFWQQQQIHFEIHRRILKI
jgi:hypothetical protein